MPGDLVRRFIRAIEVGDLDEAWSTLADDVVYDNVPIGPMTGRDNVAQALTPFFTKFDEITWPISHQVEQGTIAEGVVINARVDRFRAGDRWVELPVAGVFEIRSGRIQVWRDYFDLNSYQQQIAALSSGA